MKKILSKSEDPIFYQVEQKESNDQIPKDYLNSWLRTRLTWNHSDWMKLLVDLKTRGFGKLTDSADGREGIGQYLESHRRL